MSLPRGKSSVSPPIAITGQQQQRTITPQPRGQTPPTQYSDYLNSVLTDESYQVFSGFQQPIPFQPIGLAPGLPHDLNKGPMAAPRMPSPGVTAQAQQNMYQQAPGMRSQTPFYQPNQPQNMRSARYPQQMPITTPQVMMYVPQGQPGTPYSNQGTTQIIVQPSAGNLMLQQPRMPQPYTLPNQNFQTQQYAYNSIYYPQQQQQPSQQPQQLQRPMQGLPSQQPQPQQQTQQPLQQPLKRKKHVLEIVDPASGKNILDSYMSKQANPSNAAEAEVPVEVSGTPPPPPPEPQQQPQQQMQQQPTPQNEIAAKFAAQVAATLKKTSGSTSSTIQNVLGQYEHSQSQIPVQMMEQPIVMPMNPPPPLLPPAPDQSSNNDQIIFLGDSEVPDENVHSKLDTESPVVPEVQILQDIVRSEPLSESPEAQVNVEIQQTESVSETRDSEPRELKEKSPLSDDKSVTDYADLQQSKDVEITEYESSDINTEKSSLSFTNNSSNHNVQERTTELENVSSFVDKVGKTEPVVSPVNPSSKECSPKPENSDSVLPLQSPPQSQSPPPSVVPQVPATTATPIAPTITISVTSTTVTSTPVFVSTATVTTATTTMSAASGEPATDVISQNEKKETKKKKKDWNKKGENKEGTDMDAFVDIEGQQLDGKVQEKTEEISFKKESSPPETIEQLVEEEKTQIVEIKIEDKSEEMPIEQNEEEPKSPVKTQSGLKYKYKEDQWSPINLEGKKGYDRDFLLQLQFSAESITKPEGLPDLPEIILERPHQENQRSLSSGKDFAVTSSSFDFMPVYAKGSGGRMGSHHGGRGGSMTKNNSARKDTKIIKIDSIQKEITLHQAEKAWKPGKAEADLDEDSKKTEDLYKRTKGILNKLTPQKFSTLVDQMQKLQTDTETRLKGVIDLVFEKAISEPGFSVAYANMCRCLAMHKVTSDTKPGEQVNFRALLLTRCQREFEKDKDTEVDMTRRQEEIDKAETDEEKKILKQEMVVAETKARRRSLGNIRFIGELFKLKMLTENIMHDCVFKLLRAKDEESLECLCRLVTTIGKELDTDKAKNRMDQYFHQMHKIVNEKKASSRVRFMLQDVIELRLNKWVPRRDESAPKTIDQIHKEAQQEAIEKQLMIQQLPPQQQQQQQQQKGQRRGRHSDSLRGGPMGNVDGWNIVPPKTPLRSAERSIDVNKLKLTKQNDADSIQLGPGGGAGKFSVWHRGSTGGGSEPERPGTPSNRFSALSKPDDDHDRKRGFSSSSPARRGDSRGRGQSQGGGFGRPQARVTPRSSQEFERERAVAAVKTVIGTSGRTTPSEARSRDSSGTREREPEPERALPAASPGLSADEMEKKTKSIIDEYLHLQDMKEAIQCVSELNSPDTIHVFVYAAINHVLERSNMARQQTGNFLHDLVKKKILSVEVYLNGLNDVMQYAEDMEIDVPKIWFYFGQLIGPMIQDGSVPLKILKQVTEPLMASNKAGILVGEILQDASHRLGHKKVGELWKASGLKWSDFVPKEEIDQFLVDKKLEFTTDGPGSQPTSPTINMSYEQIQEELNNLLLKRHADDDDIFDWIEANLDEPTTKKPRFIRALMTAVCSSAITGQGSSARVEPSEIKKRGVLLQKYLDHQAEFELQALYALQAVVHKLEHPQGVLRTMFDTLYDEDIISEDAFNQWEKSDDPAEQEGKGVAMKQVVSFFTWLREAEEESQEES